MSTAIVEFSQFEADLSAYRQRYEGVVYDFGDKKQEKQARSDRLAIGKTISALDAIHKDIKAPLQEKISLLDGERKRIKDGLRDVQGGIKAQIEAHEEKLRQHEERIATRIATIAGTAIFAEAEPSLADIKLNIERLRSMIVDEETFEHRYGDAAVAKLKATDRIHTVVASYGQSAALITPEPIDGSDVSKATEAVGKIQVDNSGKENVFTALELLV